MAAKSQIEAETTAGEDTSVQTETSSDPTDTKPQGDDDVEPEIDLAQVVAATPVAMYKPGDAKVTQLAPPPPPPPQRRRSSMEEMSRRPEWLPYDWRMETRRRSSGKSAGEFDRYYFSPTGKKMRSKNEVMRFLETQAAQSANTASASGEERPAENREDSGRRKKQKVESPPHEIPDSNDGATSKETNEAS